MNARRLLVLALALGCCPSAFAIGTAFTYQGSLEDLTQPANGSYDFQFRVLNAGNAQIGPILVTEDVNVLGGVFTVQLDFGAGVFSGLDRFLEVGVRPGPSSGAFTVLSPVTPLQPVPYAQAAIAAEVADSAFSANDVVNGSIDEVDIATGAVSERTIATNAVGSAEIDDGAVTSADVANNTLTLSDVAGVASEFSISATVAANDCNDYDVTFGGDVQADDFPLIALSSGVQLPDSMSITALRVISDNLVELRICNEASVQQSTGSLTVKLITLR